MGLVYWYVWENFIWIYLIFFIDKFVFENYNILSMGFYGLSVFCFYYELFFLVNNNCSFFNICGFFNFFFFL